MIEAVGRDGGEDGGVEFQAEAYAEAGGDELTGELRLAAEAVDYPQLTGGELTAQVYYAAIAPDAMYYHRFADVFGYLCLLYEYTLLLDGGSSSVRVEPGLTDGYDPLIGGKCADPVDIGIGNTFCVPRVYADTVPRLTRQCVDSFSAIEIGDYPRAAQTMSMYVVERSEHGRLSGHGVIA